MSNQLYHSPAHTKRVLYIGLSVMLIMMAILGFTTFTILNSAEQRIQSIVQDHNEKTQLIVNMRTAARERILSLKKMLILQDPLEASSEQEHFTLIASQFLVARELILEKQNTAEEKKLLQKLFRLVADNGTLQKQTAQLIENEKYHEARIKLLNEVIPLQDDVFEFMSKMVEIQKQATKAAIADGKKESSRVVRFLLIFGLIMIIITALFSFYIIRYITNSAKMIVHEKERAQTMLHSIGDAVITTDENGKVEHLNVAAEQMLGVDSNTIAGIDLDAYAAFLKGVAQESIEQPIQEVLRNKKVKASSGDSVLLTRQGKKYGVEYTVSPVYDRKNILTGTILVIKDVSKIRILSNELAYHAKHDNLTGLINRREMEDLLEQTLTEHRRYTQQQSCLCYLDMDQFKIINDTCGHAAGDELLKQIAKILVELTRETDFVARMGGDEFAIILKHCDENTAVQIMERVRITFHKHGFCWDNKCFNTSASIGVVMIRQDVGSIQDLMSSADAACYVAKEEGRNRIHLLNDDDNKTAIKQGEMAWVHRINRAITENNFVLYYQPIKSLQNHNAPMHGEILLRLLDEDNTPIAPFAFIPAAERYNLMPEVDKYVIKHTFDELNKYYDNPQVSMGMFAINLSAQSLCEDDFLNFVITQLANFRLFPSNICFEITETAMISNMTKAISLIEALKEKGCKFALDDFGSGLSSFGYLKSLPVDYLKIDGSFVKNITTDKLDFAMVNSVNQIGDILGIDTIAEFVENEEIEVMLKDMGVNYAQGYSIGKPAPFIDTLTGLHKLRQINKNKKG